MKRTIFLLVNLIVGGSMLYSQTIINDGAEVSGTWTEANSPYLINGLATITAGNTLIIEPGAEIRFKTGTDCDYSSGNIAVDVGHLVIKGKLVAEGSSARQITFTRQGDSGNWGCVAFASTADVSSSMKYCKVEYANYILNHESGSYNGAVSFRIPKITISSSEVSNNKSSGIYSFYSTCSVYNCIIAQNGADGLNLNSTYLANDTVKVINNTIVGNASSGLFTRTTRILVANCIFWGNDQSFTIYNWYLYLSYSLVEETVLPTFGGWLKLGEGMVYNINPQLDAEYSIPYYSCCINAGIPDLSGLMLPDIDFAGNNRINLGRIDLGAFESTSEKIIRIIKPNGNRGFLAGTSQDVRWESNIASVKIEYTGDGGDTWNDIVTGMPGNGQYSWTIPIMESEFCKIRISDVAEFSVFDVCDNDFTVFTSNIPDSTVFSGRLTSEYSPYNINGLVIIPSGDTLIIDPGVEIRFKTGTDFSFFNDNSVDAGLLYVEGNLIAEGTPDQRIIFTRQGNSGNWGCIAFKSTAGLSSSLKYCKVEFANYIIGLESVSYYGALSIRNPQITISHTEIFANSRYGIYSYHSTFNIRNCIIAGNHMDGISISSAFKSSDIILVANNTIVDNGSSGLYSTAKCKIVNNIFWNNGESLNINSYTSPASYNLVQEDILSGSYLSIGEGMIYNHNPHLDPDFNPTYNSPAINAGIPDTADLDLSGYDISGNSRIFHDRIDMGAVESDVDNLICLLSPNGKEGFFPGTSRQISWKSNVDNVKLEYTADNGSNWIEITGSTPNDGIYIWNIPSAESDDYNIRISDAADYSLFDLCDFNFRVISSIIPDSTILTGRLTLENSPYYVNGLVTVPAGDSLVIDPGVIIKFKTDLDPIDIGKLCIKGKLIAEGTLNQRITFTRQGEQGNWGSIEFKAAANSSLRYCKIEYAGYNGISCQGSSPLIQNCIIAKNLKDGISCENSTPLIQNCIITDNEEKGIDIWSAFQSTDTIFIINNTITGNGLAGLSNRVKCKIVNNIFWKNTESVIKYSSSQNFLSYNLVEENEIIGSTVKIGAGMIYNLDPQFIDYDVGDFHLKITSPCIDAGDPVFPYEMEPQDNGGRINIGAYGNTPEAAKTYYLPGITYLSDRYGRMFGRDTLTIKGANFLPARGSGRVIFGNAESLEYLYWSDDSIKCITPPHLPGIIDIIIENSDAKTGFGEKCFSFQPPELKKYNPLFSKTAGGEQITLSGKLFGHSRDGVSILFDNLEALSYHSWNDTLLVLTSPSHSEGVVDLILRLNDSIYYNFSESFLFSDKPLTELCGELYGTLSGSHIYKLTCPVTVPSGQTLTIEPGVIIIAIAKPETPVTITVNGTIQVSGTPSDPVRITSYPHIRGSWNGIIANGSSFFNHCRIMDGKDGLTVSGGTLELKNSLISNNTNTGLNILGLEKYITINVDSTYLSDSKNGIYVKATGNNNTGNVTGTVSNCYIRNNDEYGIDMYSYAFTSGTIVPTYKTARIQLSLKNSVITQNGSNSVRIKSYGTSGTNYSPPARRYGYVNFSAENCLFHNNDGGIITEQVNEAYASVIIKLYSSVLYNNKPVIEMDADWVFIYNTNLWDNGISGNPYGICDSLVIVSSNVNSPDGIPNGSNNISEDPLYLAPTSGDFHLNEGSPCIDAGANEFVNSLTDFDGKVRIWNATGAGNAVVDIGAFEYGTPCYAIEIDKEICYGESYEGFTESGVYKIKYTDISGCDSVIILTLVVNPLPDKPVITQNLDTLISSESAGNQWYFNDSAIAGATGQKFVVDKSGEYYVTVTNASGCSSVPSDALNVIYSFTGTIDENGLRIYPNPVSGTITIEGLPDNTMTEIAIHNHLGYSVRRLNSFSSSVTIDLSDILSGCYVMTLRNDKRYIIKILKH